jgi:hypothetical protein
MRATACFRSQEPPWTQDGTGLSSAPDDRAAGQGGGPADGQGSEAGGAEGGAAAAQGLDPAPRATDREPVYEDWYLLEDFAALGVLNEAAAGRGHRSSHDEIAVRSGTGAGGLYALLEGDPRADALAAASLAVWISPPAHGATRRQVSEAGGPGPAELLGDGMDGARASLWRRQLVLGPAPEFCALGPEVPPGVSPARLPRGWSARTVSREVVWSG